jgi:cytoskeletal protein RodZ
MKKKNANGERLFLLLFLIFALVIAGGLGVWKLNSEESDDKNGVNLKEENNGGADNNSNNNNDNNNSNENISNNNSCERTR